MFGTLGTPEIIIIGVVIILIFGVGKLSGLGRDLGSSIKEFRRAVKDEEPEEDAPPPQVAASKTQAPPPPQVAASKTQAPPPPSQPTSYTPPPPPPSPPAGSGDQSNPNIF